MATDWVEDLVLRFAGPDVYDGWVDHEVPFTDPAIVDAIERFGAIALQPDQVAGGNRAVVELTVEDAARELLDSPRSCLLHRQASFLPRDLDRDVEISPDGDLWAFPLPAADGGEAPLVVGGTVVVRFSDDADVVRLATYLTTTEAASQRAGLAASVSVLMSGSRSTATASRSTGGSRSWCARPTSCGSTLSDLMPPEVGVGTFWSGMTSWLGGARLRSVLAEIDAVRGRPTWH